MAIIATPPKEIICMVDVTFIRVLRLFSRVSVLPCPQLPHATVVGSHNALHLSRDLSNSRSLAILPRLYNQRVTGLLLHDVAALRDHEATLGRLRLRVRVVHGVAPGASSCHALVARIFTEPREFRDRFLPGLLQSFS